MNHTGNHRRPLAIIADDEDLGRLLLEDAVGSLGLQTRSFGNGLEALNAAVEQPVMLVLLDVEMPGMNGYDVCRELRADPRFTTVPIVMVTGHEDSESIRRAFEAGATDFIAKPVNWSLLPRRLEYVLRNAASAEHIERLAYYDTLTGLPNRQRCLDLTAAMFRRAEKAGECVALIYFDLNGFKRVNDTFGHSVGDELLRVVASRLMQVIERQDSSDGEFVAARFGGDEFVVALRHPDAKRVGVRFADACQVEFERPVSYDTLEFYSTPSVGLAIFPEDGADVATVLKHADTAMYQAKAAGTTDVAVYSPAMSARMRDWLELEARLRRAVGDEILTLVYQPKFNIASRRIVGVEALLRWNDEEYGDVSPGRFIEIAEESGLVIELSKFVIRSACKQLRVWWERGLRIPIAINCSAKELLHGDTARVVAEEAAIAGVPTSLIEIEITETLLLTDSDGVKDVLRQLRQLGCRIALDDFGTGYSSLAYITRFPPDRIKIDKAFIRDLTQSQGNAAIANAILSLANTLGLTVTAEGVERVEQLEWLHEHGCHEAQGFLLSHPLSAEEVEKRMLSSARAADEFSETPPRTALGND